MVEEEGEDELEEMDEGEEEEGSEMDADGEAKENIIRKKSTQVNKLLRQTSVQSTKRGIMSANTPVIGDDGADGMRTMTR